MALNALSFRDYNTFQSFAFNTDYSKNENITSNVWFIATQDTLGGEDNTYFDYFKRSNHKLTISATVEPKQTLESLSGSDKAIAYKRILQNSYGYGRPELTGANLRSTRLRIYFETSSKGTETADKGFAYHDAFSRLGKDGIVDMTYGATIINPYPIDTALKFNSWSVANKKDAAGDDTTSDAYLRFIKDVVFDNNTQTATTFNTEFEGDLEGNGLTIKNLRILADNESNNAFSFGLFSKIKGANVRNVNIEVEELWGVNVPVVGVLAGIITNKITEKSDSQGNRIVVGSSVSNIKISTNSAVTVQGLNVVGGVAGIVEGDSYLINTTNTVPVKANFRGNINIFSRNNSVNTHYSSYRLVDLSSLDNVEFDNVKTTHYTLTDNHVTTGDHQCTSVCSSHDEQYIVYITKEGEAAPVQNVVEEGDENFIAVSESIAAGTLSNLVSYYKSYKYKGLYDGISYVGGIAGIINVDEEIHTEDTKLRNFVRIRRNYVDGRLTLSGQVVGGLFGYVGSSSHISDSYLLVDSNTHINATRVAGGLVGENLGTINRSYFVHTLVNQELIDDYIYRNRTQLDNAINDIYISGNTGGKYFAVQYEVFGGNPHYMGGLVGINVTGIITRSYNKVPVNNLDAEYAGGLVGVSMGGEIGESYTTATVSAFRAFGGIIGIQTGLTNKTSYLDENGDTQYTDNDGYNHFNSFAQSPLTKLFEESYYIYKDGATPTAGFNGINTVTNHELADGTTSDGRYTTEYTYIHDLVGSNVWVTSHLNINRSARFQRNADDAYVGLLAGISMFVFSTTTKTDGTLTINSTIANDTQYRNAGFVTDMGSSLLQIMNDRVINDSNFFKATWQYDQSESDPTKELVYEIGLTPDAITSDLNLKAQDAIIKGMQAQLTEPSIKGQEIVTKNSKARMLYGYRALSRIYLFSRMSMFGSLRSLNEITSRITLANDAKSFYLQFNGEDIDDVNEWDYDAEDEGKTIMRQQMYYDWSLAEWNGISADNETGRKDETYVFPELSNQIEPTIVNVYTEAELKLMKQYMYADFVLQNDVELTTPWEPVGTKENPFYGSIYSARKADGTYNHFYITNLEIMESTQNIAFVAYAREGSYHDFGIKVNYVKNTDFSTPDKTTDGRLHKVAVLLAEATTVSVENFDITNEIDAIPESQRPHMAEIQSGHTSMLGLIIAHGETCSIINSNVENFKIHVSSDAQDVHSLFAGSAFGLLVNASWVDGINVRNGTIDNAVEVSGKTASGITNPTYAVSIGSVGGYIEITPLHEGKDLLDDTSSATVENVILTLSVITINQNLPTNLDVTAKEIVTKAVPSGFIAFGGVYGTTDAGEAMESTKATFDTIVTNNVKLNFNALNNNSVSYDTRIGGVTGWAKNGNFENVLSNTEIKTENTLSINNANIGGVFGFADHTDTADNLLYNSKIALNGTISQTLSNSNVGGIAGNIAECGDFTHLYVGNTSNFFETSYKTNDLNVAPVAGKVTNTTLQYVAVDGTVDIILNSQSTHDTVGGVVGMYYVTNSARSNIIDQVVTNANLYLYAETNSDNTVDCVGGIAAGVENSVPTTISNSYTTSAIYVRDNGVRNAYVGGVVGCKTENGILTLNNVYSIANFVTDAYNYNTTNRKDLVLNLGSDVAASKITMNNVYAAFDINPNITNRWDYPYHDSYHTSKTIAEMMDSLFIDNFDSELWTASTLGSLKSFPLLKWVDSWVDEWINENAQKGYYYNGNFYADSEHTALIQPEQNVTYYNMDDGKAYTWKDSDTGYVELTNGIINMVKTIVNTQSSGTKQNPANGGPIDGTKSVYVGSGAATFTGNITDSYIILGESVTMSGGGDKVIDKTSIVMRLELPESAQSSLVRDNLGKLLNIKAVSSTPLMRANTGLIFNSYLENTGSEYVINRLAYGNEGSTMSPYEGVVAISTLKTQGTQVIPRPVGIIDRVRAEMHPNSSSVNYFASAANNSYIQTSDGCVYIKDASTIASYTTADIKNLRFGNPIALDYTQFTLDPSDPENIRLVLTWELKEHWYDRNYKTVTVNGTSYLCEDNNSIKAEYRWNAVFGALPIIRNGKSYTVSTAKQLALFAKAYNASDKPSVILNIQNDINLQGKLWTPIDNFNGTINGNGHTISNLTVYIVNGNAGFINGLYGTINELKFEWANVMSGSMSYGNSSEHLNSFASTAIVASKGTGFSLNKVAVVNCAACSTISTSTAMCSWTSGNCTITDSYAIMPYKGVLSTLFARKDSGTLAITNCYGVFTADRNKNSVTLTNESGNNFVQGTSTNGSTYTNGYTFSCVYHSENIATITHSDNNKTTQKSLSELQTEEWAGFAWGVTWVRNSATDGTDPYSNLPQLVVHMETWQEYAIANKDVIKTVADSHFNSSSNTITISGNGDSVSAAAELAYVAWQLGLSSGDADANSNLHRATLKVYIPNTTNLSGRLWVPITFSSGYTSVTFEGEGNAIKNMLVLGTTDNAFIKYSNLSSLTIDYIMFDNAKVYTTANGSGTEVGNTAIVVAKADGSATSLTKISIKDSAINATLAASQIDKNIGVGAIVGYSNNTKISSCHIYSFSESVTNAKYVGGLAGYSKSGDIYSNYFDDDSLTIDATSVKNGKDSYVGGLVGYWENSSKEFKQGLSVAGSPNKVGTLNTSGMRYVGGAVGYFTTSSYGISDKIYRIWITSNDAYRLGGIAGYIAADSDYLTLYRLTFSGDITANSTSAVSGYVGGLFGEMYKCKMYECMYKDGSWSDDDFCGTFTNNNGNYNVGGIAGYEEDCYFNNIFNGSRMRSSNSVDGLIYKINSAKDHFGLCVSAVNIGEQRNGKTDWEQLVYQQYSGNSGSIRNYGSPPKNRVTLLTEGSAFACRESFTEKYSDNNTATCYNIWQPSNNGKWIIDFNNVLNNLTTSGISNSNDWNSFKTLIRMRYYYTIENTYVFKLANNLSITMDSPVGVESYQFNSTFSGNGYHLTVSNWTYTGTNNGIFGYGKYCVITNITINGNAPSVINYSNVGAMFGYLESGTIQYSAVRMDYDQGTGSGSRVGGVVGYAKNSTFNTVEYNPTSAWMTYPFVDAIGGIVGESHGCTITGCKCYGNVYGSRCSGGIVGHCYGATTIENCRVGTDYITISGTTYVGGIAGYVNSNSTIRNNIIWFKSELATSSVGGVVGQANSDATITGNTIYAAIYVSVNDTNTKDGTLLLRDVSISVNLTKNMSKSSKYDCNISQNTAAIFDRDVNLSTNSLITTWLGNKNIHYVTGNLGDSTSNISSNTISSYYSHIYVCDTYYRFSAAATEYEASYTPPEGQSYSTYINLSVNITLYKYKYSYSTIDSSYNDASTYYTYYWYNGCGWMAWNWANTEECVDYCIRAMNDYMNGPDFTFF
ncbi:MAG: hypothetical protein J6X00_03470 [Clostridia bacterium]|nr:hypothetical protein [Clostridia bacterium]